MEIRIDTRRDSPDEIRKTIRFLEELIEDQTQKKPLTLSRLGKEDKTDEYDENEAEPEPRIQLY